jgi:hypothetical protein
MGQIGEEIEEGVEPYEDTPFEIPAPSVPAEPARPEPAEPVRVPVPA